MKLQRKELQTAILGGLIAQITFEAYAWLLSPIFFGEQLEPANLVMGLFKKYLGVSMSYEAAFGVHTLIGIVGFGIFTLLFYKLFRARALLSGFVAGLALWFIAQGMLAPALGRDFMMGFGPYTQSSFFAHVGMAIIITLFLRWKLKTQQENQVK